MYFDPLSAWLVTLIADGIIIAGEKSRGGSAAEYNQQRVKQANNMLNGDIRRVRSKYGLDLPELAYEQIQLHVRVTKKSFSFHISVYNTHYFKLIFIFIYHFSYYIIKIVHIN